MKINVFEDYYILNIEKQNVLPTIAINNPIETIFIRKRNNSRGMIQE